MLWREEGGEGERGEIRVRKVGKKKGRGGNNERKEKGGGRRRKILK